MICIKWVEQLNIPLGDFWVDDFYDIVNFIKGKLPSVNVFETIINGGLDFSDMYIDFSFTKIDQLDNSIIEDLSQYLSIYLVNWKYDVFSYNYELAASVIKSIKYLFPFLKKDDISEDIVIMLNNYISNNYYWCTIKCCDKCLNNSKSKSFFRNEKGCIKQHTNDASSEYLPKYNTILDTIFQELEYLNELNIISLDKIGNISKYKVY